MTMHDSPPSASAEPGAVGAVGAPTFDGSSSPVGGLARRHLRVLTVSYLAIAIPAIAVDRHLYADGSAYLLYDMLLGGHFVFPQRTFSYVYYQGPTLAAIAAGVRAIGALSWLFGCVLFSPPLVGAWLSWWVCRRTDVRLAFFPIFGCLTALLSWAFYPVTEVHLTVSAFWPLFCFVLSWPEDRPVGLLTLVTGGVILLFFGLSHDSAVFLGPGLAAAAAWRAWTMSPGTARAAVVAVGFGGAMATANHAWVNLSSMAVNQSNYLTGLSYAAWNRLLVLHLAAAACVLVCFVPRVRQRFTTAVTGGLLLLGLYVVYETATSSIGLRPWIHQATRAGAPLFTVLWAAITAGLSRTSAWNAADWRRIWQVATICMATGFAWHLLATSQWAGYRRVMMDELSQRDGLIEVETTALASDHVGLQTLRPMVFLWELPHQSILWSKPQVTSIVYSEKLPRLSAMLGTRDFSRLAAFNRFVPPSLVP